MKREWKVLSSIGLAAVLCGTYVWGIPAIINLPKHKAEIEHKIFEQTGLVVDIGNPELSMGAFPSVWIKTNNLSVLNKDNSKALSVSHPKAKIKLFPLIEKKLEISQFYASDLNSNFVLTENKQFLLGDNPLKFKKDGKFKFSALKMNLGPYKIHLDDRLNNQEVSLNGEYLTDVQYLKDDKLSLGTIGDFTVGNKSTHYFADLSLDLPLTKFTDDKLKIAADIENFDVSSISDYVNILSKGKIKQLSGILDFNASTKVDNFGHKLVYTKLKTQGLNIISKDVPSSIIFPEELNVNADFATFSNGINFKNAQIKSKDFNLGVKGKLSSSGKKIPAMDLTVEAKPSVLEEVCKIIPGLPNLLPEMDLYKLKEYFFYGKGEGKVRFVGNGSRPEVFGGVKLRNVYVQKPIPIAPDGASVDLVFKGKVMDIDVEVPMGKDNNVSVKGFIKIDGTKYSELKIKSTGEVSMEPAQDVLNPLHEIFKFKLGPVPIMKLKGLATVDIFSAGKKVDPHLFGNLKFRNATASFNDIHNLVLYNGSGEINFNNTEIPFKTYTATINGRPAEVYGKCNVMGDLNVFAKTTGQKIPDMIKVINSSPEMADVQRVVKPFTKPDGIGDLFLNIYGNAKDVTQVEFNKDIFAKGTITLHNATTVLKDTFLPLHKINGVVNFNKKDADYDLTGYIRESKVHVKGTANDTTMDLTATSDKFAIADCMDTLQPYTKLPYKKEIGQIDVSFVGKYKGIADSDNLDYSKVIVDGKMLSNMNSSNPVKVNGGNFTIRNGILKTGTFTGLFNNNPYTLSFTGTDIYETMKIKDADFSMNDFDISSLNAIKEQLEIPAQLKSQIENIDRLEGKIDINGKIRNGGIYADTNLQGIKFIYTKPIPALIEVLSGSAKARGDKIYFDKINSRVASMPVFINGNASNIYKNPYLTLYLSAKPTQKFFDILFNSTSVYPVKVKGDVHFSAKVGGTLKKLYAHTALDVKENSSLYYMGATLAGAPTGDINSDGMSTNPVSIISDVILYPNRLHVTSMTYNQSILSQSNRKSLQNHLTASGDINLLKDNVIGFNNFKIKTNEPTNARIFNILLKKPTIKQGMFTTDLTINGTSLAPQILGFLNISNIDIPLFDATIRDINLDFQNDFINVLSKGVILTSDINLFARIANKLTPPYSIEDLKIQAEKLDLNKITTLLNDLDIDNLRKHRAAAGDMAITPDFVYIKNADVNADNIIIKKAIATDFSANFNIANDNMLRVNDYNFHIANGTVNGKIDYNLDNLSGNATMSIKDADAQIIAESFFDMAGQMYGTVTGDMNVSCKGASGVDCLKTLSGNGQFKVIDGRMPKLGSLEYLLKATNLVTGGITGLSINGIIDLITPLKTGNFESISGDIKVKDGVANDINVYSSGKDLNIYLTGSYDFSTLIANMTIYGSLSKDFSTILGKISNLSLNRLLNTIPGIKFNEINPKSTSDINKIPNFDKTSVLRVFRAEIEGDINSSNYVKSFHWIRK